jgi:hypothetical protein
MSDRRQPHFVSEPSPEKPVLQPRNIMSDWSLSDRQRLMTPSPFSYLDREEGIRRGVNPLLDGTLPYLAGASDSGGGRSDRL